MASRGELEQRVLEVLWDAGEAMTVAAVHRTLHDERELAYTTVMTVLDRLAKKRLVRRSLVGRAWEYVPAMSQESLVSRELLAALKECSPKVQAGALRLFARGLDETQADALTRDLTIR